MKKLSAVPAIVAGVILSQAVNAANLVPAATLTGGIGDLTDTAQGLFSSLLPVALTIAVLGVAYRMAKSWFKKAG